MSYYIEKVEKVTLPVVVLKNVVAFPSIPISIEITDAFSKKAVIASKDDQTPLLLLSLNDVTAKKPFRKSDFEKVGTAVKVKEYLKLPGNNIRAIFEGLCRATVTDIAFQGQRIWADTLCKKITSPESEPSLKETAALREGNEVFERFAKYLPKLSDDVKLTIQSIKNCGLFADYIACNILISYEDKMAILSEYDPMKRIETLIVIMEREIRILEAELSIHKKVIGRIEAGQKEHYLREQMKVIQNELGYGDEGEGDEYFSLIEDAHLPKEVHDKLLKDAQKLQKMPYGSAESSVLRTYLDTCLELPWDKKTKDRIDVSYAKKILEEDHDGLDKVKERILEYLAVKQLNPELKNQIICLAGPPGTGKTSIAQSIAHAMNRKYVRVALGGIRDEADIRGHRKTYVGSMPGRIITAINQAGVKNPLILLDEVDKLTSDAHGDPSSALLEVLDGEQNKNFRDHFIELPFDLSECVFICTANEVGNIPRPLLDRMELIELEIYTRTEKLMIAKHHLVKKQMKRHGLKRGDIVFADDGITEIIDSYTKEAGVRNLEREIGSICRKAARDIVENKIRAKKVDRETVKLFLGPPKIIKDSIFEYDEIGIVNGLAYTEVGGDLLRIEVAVMPGNGKIELTGSLGDVMKESAKTAVSYVRQVADEYGIDPDFYKTKDIHIHVPEGAVPKDGPSAGVTITTALISRLSDIPVRRDVAMTGEVTLTGRVLPIGGLREKTMAAYKAGVKTVLVPKENERDMDKLDPEARNGMEFFFCSCVADVLDRALIEKGNSKKLESLCKEESKLPDSLINITNKRKITQRQI